MKLIKYFLCLLTIFFVISCASTKITSFKDPAYQKADFKRVLVIANTYDLEDRQSLESRMVESFNNVGIYAVESFRLFPPTRDLTDEEKVEIILKKDIDSFISISVGESGVNQVYVPPTGSTTKTKGNVTVYGNTAKYKEKSETTYNGGYNLSKPWAEFETQMFDVSNGQLAWIATSHTGGNAYANKNTVIGSYCDATVDRLIEENLITEIIEQNTYKYWKE